MHICQMGRVTCCALMDAIACVIRSMVLTIFVIIVIIFIGNSIWISQKIRMFIRIYYLSIRCVLYILALNGLVNSPYDKRYKNEGKICDLCVYGEQLISYVNSVGFSNQYQYTQYNGSSAWPNSCHRPLVLHRYLYFC